MTEPAALADRLRRAPLELVGRFADASNATLLVLLLDRDARGLDAREAELGRPVEVDDLPSGDLAVYKPLRGERPLRDFPAGTLHRREVAAYEVSAALGWELVPLTVLRDDAPLGPGSLQRFVPHDLGVHFFRLLEEADDAVLAQLEAMVVFDVLVNNADRKGGHVLLEETPPRGPRGLGGRVRLIDHGVTFHAEPKLRTVGWHLAGRALPRRLRRDLERLRGDERLHARLARLLSDEELRQLSRRRDDLLERGVLPEPVGPRPTPWPLL